MAVELNDVRVIDRAIIEGLIERWNIFIQSCVSDPEIGSVTLDDLEASGSDWASVWNDPFYLEIFPVLAKQDVITEWPAQASKVRWVWHICHDMYDDAFAGGVVHRDRQGVVLSSVIESINDVWRDIVRAGDDWRSRHGLGGLQ